MPAQAHPHLFFTSDDLEAIRAKTRHLRYSRDWEALKAAADESLEQPIDPELEPTAVASHAARRAGTSAFAYRMTDEAGYGAHARELIEVALEAGDWTGNYIPGAELQFHLRTAALCSDLAMAYDLLAEEMCRDERRHFLEVCRQKAIQPFLADTRLTTNMYLYGVRTMNWLSTLCSGAGCLLLALDGDEADLSLELEVARAHMLRFVEWYDESGASLEHGGYWVGGMGRTLQFLVALRENGWPKIFDRFDLKLRRTAYPILYGCIGGLNVSNFGDDQYGPLGAREAALILASEFQDGRLQWWAEQMPSRGAMALICGDPNLPATPPDGLPTCAVFDGCGMAVLRDSMTDPDAKFLGLKAGRARAPIYDGPHCQFDLNSVVLDAFGAALIADPGYGHNWISGPLVTDPDHHSNSTPPHNTLLVDGAGQLYEHCPIAHLQDLSPTDEIDYVVSRIECGYGPKVKRFDRHVYMIDKSFYVLIDDVQLAEPGTLTWNFHAREEARIECGDGARIVNAGAQVTIIPFGDLELECGTFDDHVLPRLQWEGAVKVAEARVGWLLWPERAGEGAEPPTASLTDEGALVTSHGREWSLPVVQRRASYRSALRLAPGLEEEAERLLWRPTKQR